MSGTSIARAVFICEQLYETLQVRNVTLNDLSDRSLKRALIPGLSEEPTLTECLDYAERVVTQIREIDIRITQMKEQRAMSILESYAGEFNLPYTEEADEEEEERGRGRRR